MVGHRLQQKRPYTNKFVHYTQKSVYIDYRKGAGA